jgi:hypothetical protein
LEAHCQTFFFANVKVQSGKWPTPHKSVSAPSLAKNDWLLNVDGEDESGPENHRLNNRANGDCRQDQRKIVLQLSFVA